MANKKIVTKPKDSVIGLLKNELLSHKFLYLILFVVLLCATFLRVFRADQVLGFYFDQGRDALVVADFLQNGKWFLIGPTTGIAGIFRGPFYYYLIAPFYWLGNGNPVFPSVFLELTTVVALGFLYYLGAQISGRVTGLIAVTIASFSYYIVYASRWLSNPTPMLLLSLLLFWLMVLIQKGKQWAWIPLSFVAGSSLFHFGSSGEFFYFPALGIFALWQWGVFKGKLKLPKIHILALSVFVFALTAAPLVIFDLRHDRILSQNIMKFFGADESFKASFWQVANTRIEFFAEVFFSKVFLSKGVLEKTLMLIVLGVGLVKANKLFKNVYVRTLMLLLISPIVGLMFFQGNEGNVYDYYLTGYYLLFILFLAVCLRETLRVKVIGFIVVFIFIFISIKQNIAPGWSWIHDGLDGPTTIAFGNQKQAVNWVYSNANGEQFNVDAYVPPVIPYAYTYLFRWYDTAKLGKGLAENQTPLLYTIYEVDPPHPERLEAWLKRQAGIGKVLEEVKFGGITVQKRTRI